MQTDAANFLLGGMLDAIVSSLVENNMFLTLQKKKKKNTVATYTYVLGMAGHTPNDAA
jgi:undecaprenyl pyrophosphate phosphatase UppP